MADKKDEIEEDEESAEDAALAAVVSAAKKKKLVMLGGLVAAILLLAGGGTWFALHLLSDKEPVVAEQPVVEEESKDAKDPKAAKGKAAAKVEKPKKEPAVYDAFESAFLANYLVNGRQHYVQLSLTLMARDEEAFVGLHTHMPLIRNRVVMLLSGEEFAALQTDEGRVQLQHKLLVAIQEILQKETGKSGIEQVFFTNFVMQ